MVYMMRDVANLEYAARRSLTNDGENVWMQSITPIANKIVVHREQAERDGLQVCFVVGISRSAFDHQRTIYLF